MFTHKKSNLSTEILNAKLGYLKNIFDQIESYPSDINVGLRSIKNLGVWLTLFALTAKEDQENIINELVELTQIHMDNKTQLRDLIYELCQADYIKQIISDYEKSGGSFKLEIPKFIAKEFLAKAEACGLKKIIETHLGLGNNLSELQVSMKNKINFLWQAGGKNIQLIPIQLKFDNEEKESEFLCNQKEVNFAFVNHDEKIYNVFRLSSKQASPKQEGYVFLVYPNNQNDYQYLAQDYNAILNKITNNFNFNSHYQALYEHNKLKEVRGLHFTESNPGAIKNNFFTTVRFPALSSDLKTSEKRPGIYQVFQGKSIGAMKAELIKYSGERELHYDESGGKVINYESFGLIQGSCETPKTLPNRVELHFKITDPYYFIYSTQKARDYYPFQIHNPHTKLQTQSKEKDYPVVKVSQARTNLFTPPTTRLVAQEEEKAHSFTTHAEKSNAFKNWFTC